MKKKSERATRSRGGNAFKGPSIMSMGEGFTLAGDVKRGRGYKKDDDAVPPGATTTGAPVALAKRQQTCLQQWNPLQFVPWLRKLSARAGLGLLVTIVAVQHLQKGLVQSYVNNSISFYFRDKGGVSASTLQIYISVTMTPWALKGLVGVGSDSFSLFGYHKVPYMLLTAVGAVLALFAVGTTPVEEMGIGTALLCFFIAQMHIALNDLLVEAKYSEKIQRDPAINSDLVSFVWGGMAVMSLLAVGTVGLVIEKLGARTVYALCCAPVFVGSIPVAFNAFGDQKVPGERCCAFDDVAVRGRGKQYAFLAGLMTALGIGLALSGVFYKNIKFNFVLAIVCGLITILGFFRWTPPMVARVNAYTLIQTLFSMSIEGATFYFFTDPPYAYPEGPHFSDWFYTTAIGLVASGTAIVGIWVFNIYLKNMKYRSIFLWSTIVYSCLSLVNIIVFLRANKKWGVSDKLFVLGSQALQTVIKEFNYMPMVMIMSRLCPRGLEATMFALLASASNLGAGISNYSGAFLLEMLDIKPKGAKNEQDQFKNLWIAALITSLLPMIPLVLLPYLVPDARPHDLGPLPGIGEDDPDRPADREEAQGHEEETKGLLEGDDVEDVDEEVPGSIVGSQSVNSAATEDGKTDGSDEEDI